MADETSHTDSHGAAESIALGARGPLDPRAASYLEKQGRLADLQAQNLIDQNAFELSHLRWRRFSDQMSGALQMMLAGVALLIFVGLIAAIWDAANDNGLVVESFSVPPDLAAKGLTGDVIANKILDRLSQFQAQTTSLRASASYANNWGNDIKVQIPNTGVSIGEFNRALHQWLGHETHISGEVYRTPAGLALSARVGGESTPIFQGNEASIDAMIDKAAQSIYRNTQPYRYAAWLGDHGHTAEDNAILQSVVDTGDARERAWAYNGLAHNTIVTGDVAAANVFARKAVESDPTILLPQINFSDGEVLLGQEESALAATQRALKTAQAGDPTFDKSALPGMTLELRAKIALLLGDYVDVLDLARKVVASATAANPEAEITRGEETEYCGLLHDLACLRTVLTSLPPTTDQSIVLGRQGSLQQGYAALENWRAIVRAAPAFHEALPRSPFMHGVEWFADKPIEALALANLGDTKTARALIGSTPADCVPCLRIRARIAAVDHDWNAANYWFARAAALTPSVPLSDNEWGRMLLAKGDANNAIAKFAAANKLGPHFADPLEGWGEALMAQNRSDLAVAKFAEAAKYAPNWARLHLKWGEALWWSGDKDAARKQFAIAAALKPTSAEKSELMQLNNAHG